MDSSLAGRAEVTGVMGETGAAGSDFTSFFAASSHFEAILRPSGLCLTMSCRIPSRRWIGWFLIASSRSGRLSGSSSGTGMLAVSEGCASNAGGNEGEVVCSACLCVGGLRYVASRPGGKEQT